MSNIMCSVTFFVQLFILLYHLSWKLLLCQSLSDVISSICSRGNRRAGRRSSPARRSRSPVSRRSRSPRHRSRSKSRDKGSSSRYGAGSGRGAVAGSSLLAELSKYKKGREVVLKKQKEDSHPGTYSAYC